MTAGLQHTLFQAAAADDARAVRAALVAGADPLARDEDQRRGAWFWAAYLGSVNALGVMLRAAAESGETGGGDFVNARDNSTEPAPGWTALHHASLAGRARAVSLLLSCGAEVNALSRTGQTALDVAGQYADPEGEPAAVREMLVAAGGVRGKGARILTAEEAKFQEDFGDFIDRHGRAFLEDHEWEFALTTAGGGWRLKDAGDSRLLPILLAVKDQMRTKAVAELLRREAAGEPVY